VASATSSPRACCAPGTVRWKATSPPTAVPRRRVPRRRPRRAGMGVLPRSLPSPPVTRPGSAAPSGTATRWTGPTVQRRRRDRVRPGVDPRRAAGRLRTAGIVDPNDLTGWASRICSPLLAECCRAWTTSCRVVTGARSPTSSTVRAGGLPRSPAGAVAAAPHHPPAPDPTRPPGAHAGRRARPGSGRAGRSAPPRRWSAASADPAFTFAHETHWHGSTSRPAVGPEYRSLRRAVTKAAGHCGAPHHQSASRPGPTLRADTPHPAAGAAADARRTDATAAGLMPVPPRSHPALDPGPQAGPQARPRLRDTDPRSGRGGGGSVPLRARHVRVPHSARRGLRRDGDVPPPPGWAARGDGSSATSVSGTGVHLFQPTMAQLAPTT
jgi:hypothetical protein